MDNAVDDCAELPALAPHDEKQDACHLNSEQNSDDPPEASTGISIAFAEEIVDEVYYFRSFLPSKIGGKPAWLNPRNIPKYADLKCKQCSKPLKFLLQLYAPLYQFERSHHRILYVFICAQHECCGKAGSLKVLRSQLPQHNAWYPVMKSDEEAQTVQRKEDELFAKLSKFKKTGLEPLADTPNCVVCGLYGSFQCAACRNPLVKYCSKHHQKYHWYKQHRTFCKDKTAARDLETQSDLYTCLRDYSFPVFEIIPDAEPPALTINEETNGDDGAEKRKFDSLMRKYKKNKGDMEYNEEDLKLLEKQMADDFDARYLKFQERIHRAPQQIIRYSDGDGSTADSNVEVVLDEKNESEDNEDDEEVSCDRLDEPLWMGSEGIIDCKNDVPACALCGGIRKFEFQVMPQLLHILKQGVKDLDWGILAVFSCVNSCGDGNEKYFEEFVHYQASHGAFEQRDSKGWIG